MTGYLYHGSNVNNDELKDMECQAGPEDNPCESKDFLLSLPLNDGAIIAKCKKCGSSWRLTPSMYDVELLKDEKPKKVKKVT